MTLETNAFTTFSAIGNREDLADDIYRIDPTETPFVSGVDAVKATHTLHEWQTQALAAAAANAQLEGDAISADAATATARLNNRCQISRKVPRVTNTQQAMDTAGRDDEMAYQEMLKGLELKRDIEYNCVGLNVAKVTGNSTTARKSGTILTWIATNDDFGATGASPTGDGTDTRTDGTQRAFTEASLKTVLQSCWDQGGKPDSIFVGGFNKQVFSSFTGRATPMEDTSKKKIVAAVDVYESDFGKLKVIASHFSRTRDALVLQMDMWAIAYLRKFVSLNMAITGDSISKALISEWCLEARNEKASGLVADLTTS